MCMAETYSISLDDDVAERLEAETSDYGDNRSAVVEEGLRLLFDMDAEAEA